VQFDLVTRHDCADKCSDSDCIGGTPTGSTPTVEARVQARTLNSCSPDAPTRLGGMWLRGPCRYGHPPARRVVERTRAGPRRLVARTSPSPPRTYPHVILITSGPSSSHAASLRTKLRKEGHNWRVMERCAG
jgi:hypothetical protein